MVWIAATPAGFHLQTVYTLLTRPKSRVGLQACATAAKDAWRWRCPTAASPPCAAGCPTHVVPVDGLAAGGPAAKDTVQVRQGSIAVRRADAGKARGRLLGRDWGLVAGATKWLEQCCKQAISASDQQSREHCAVLQQKLSCMFCRHSRHESRTTPSIPHQKNPKQTPQHSAQHWDLIILYATHQKISSHNFRWTEPWPENWLICCCSFSATGSPCFHCFPKAKTPQQNPGFSHTYTMCAHTCVCGH